ERVSIGGGAISPSGGGAIGAVLRLWKDKSDKSDVVMRDRVMQAWVDAEVLRLTNLRAAALRQVGTPGPEGSIGKVMSADLNKRIYSLAVDLMGPQGTLYDSYEMRRPATAMETNTVTKAFLRARANSIEGGTSEIMRNILGERVLGLPGDVRVDKELPWTEVPRS